MEAGIMRWSCADMRALVMGHDHNESGWKINDFT